MEWKRREHHKPKIKVKRLRENSVIPTRGTAWSGGLDLYSEENVTLWPGDIKGFQTGICIEIPYGYCGFLLTRSSLGKYGVRLAAGANLIDADYRGEIMVYLRNDGEYPWTVRKGNRIAQLVIAPYLDCYLVEVDELSETERGAGGFGSTGE